MPGPEIRTRSVDMDFRYGSAFGAGTPDAYDRLLLDCMLGDQTLFTRSDEVEAAWQVVTPVLSAWEGGSPVNGSGGAPPVHSYEAGTWGPQASEEMLNRDGRRWRRL